MDPRLLEYYTKELLYMRELAGEFATAHPKIARRLGMHGGEIGDIYAERLIESSALMFARVQIKIDEEFPHLTQPLLQSIYPNYLSPTPSISVARFYPEARGDDLLGGYRIARGTTLTANVPDGEKTACEFRSSQDVILYPLEVVAARLTGVPPDIPSLDRYAWPDAPVCGALRLRLRTTNGADISNLQGLDRLPVYLCGEEALVSQLFELIHTAGQVSLTGTPGHFADQPLGAVQTDAVVFEGLEPGQSLLPLNFPKFHGHNLLHEYFACSSRFYFFALTGLAQGLSRVSGSEAEIVVLLTRSTTELAGKVDASSFALFSTPIVNLFPRQTGRLELPIYGNEVQVVPVQRAPLDYEVFSVATTWGQATEDSVRLEFLPLHAALQADEGGHNRYFTTRREMRELPGQARRYGTHTRFISSELFLSLVNGNGEPYSDEDEAIRYATLEVWLTNRDLPLLVPRDGRGDLKLEESGPVAGIGLVHAPSPPIPPYAQGARAWEFIEQLNLSYLTFDDCSGEALRRLLRLYLKPDESAQRRQIDSLIRVETKPVNRIVRDRDGPRMGRGIECRLTVDETGFGGVSPYLFGLVLSYYVARHVSTHSFTQTQLHSVQRGRIATYPIQLGTRGVA